MKPIVENIKQVEYLNDIRNVGMNIIYGTVNGEEAYEIFEKYQFVLFYCIVACGRLCFVYACRQ